MAETAQKKGAVSMFFRILKKDLKRKKTMNIILLLFVILASMFTSSSVNNILAVTKGLDFFAEQSGISDYLAISGDKPDNIYDMLEDKSYVTSLRSEKCFVSLPWADIRLNGEKIKEMSDSPLCMPEGEMKLNYFDIDNKVITDVPKGQFYSNTHFCSDTDLKVGDKVTFKKDGKELVLEYKGIAKDIIFGSQLTTNARLLLDDSDANYLFEDTAEEEGSSWFITYIGTTDENAVKDDIAGADGIIFQGSKNLLKLAFSINMIVAYILLAVSIGLFIISLVILRFTIQFTIADELQEIGVMKAVGIDDLSIRKIYLTKYLGLSVIGSAIGFALSLPLGNLMLKTVSDIIYIGNIHSVLAGAVCSVLIVAIILMFCYRCTGRIKKLSPIDAVRSGQTGERFGKRGVIHLGKSKLPATPFLALNDIFSSPKQFGMITAIFTICLLLVTVISNLSTTLNSDRLLYLVGVAPADAYYENFDGEESKNYGKTDDSGEEFAQAVSKKLKENGMPAKCTFNHTINAKVCCKDKSESVRLSLNKDESMDSYVYNEGYAPASADEIALTSKLLDKLGASIGDYVTLEMSSGKKKYLVTASFSSLNNTGSFGILHNSFDLAKEDMTGSMGISVHFDGSPDKEQVAANIKKMREIFDTDQVYDGNELITKNIGVGDALDAVKALMIVIMVLVVTLMTVLIERSFISKEKSEIALMKAIGTTSGEIVAQHTLRFVMISAVVCIVASAATIPLSNLLISPVLSIVCEVKGVKCATDPLDIFVVSPLILLAITALGAFFTALYTRTITSTDTASNE